jgi:hypothetical protein
MAGSKSPKEARSERKLKDETKGPTGRVVTVGDNSGPSHNHSILVDEATGFINVSQSKVRAWRQCRRQFHNKFERGLQRKKIKRPFMFGRIAHEMIEASYKGKKPFKLLDKIDLDNKKLFRREIEMYGNIIEDMKDIMTDYFDYWGDSAVPIKGPDGEMAEHEFRIELQKGLWFTGKIDAIAKAKKMRWLVEHKTFARMPSEDERWRNVQSAVYFKALYELGFKRIDGVLWDYISSKPPMFPQQLLQSGKYSQAKLNTIPARLDRWIKSEGLKKADYTKLRTEAMENRSNWFIRVYSPVKPRVVDVIWDNFVDTAKEIADNHQTKSDMNIGRHCTWCDYQPLCKAEMTGADVDWLIEREYTTEAQRAAIERGDDRSED